MKNSVIFLAGGIGSRVGKNIPKQFLTIKEKPVFSFSLDVFLSMTDIISEIIVVCDEKYQFYFKKLPVIFAPPGKRRQDSLFNGLQKVSPNTNLVCIHDSARPNIDAEMIKRTITAAEKYGAATTGMPINYTIKEVDDDNFVKKTLDRSAIWEIQTPQIIKYELLVRGFEKINKNSLNVTDDVSIIELLRLPVKVVEGNKNNIKITTPEDLDHVQL